MTEVVATIAADRVDTPVTAGSCGHLLPGVQARIDQESCELWIRSPALMTGYLGRPDATAATVDADGWLHTGDVAHFDENGALFVVDRIKELIKVKAFQVAPAELEAVLRTHPAVADAAVIGVPDERSGEVPKAFVVARTPVSADGIALCEFFSVSRGKLPNFSISALSGCSHHFRPSVKKNRPQ